MYVILFLFVTFAFSVAKVHKIFFIMNYSYLYLQFCMFPLRIEDI